MLPGHTTPGWYRCTLATILLAHQSCCRLLWGRPWIGPWGWGLQGPHQTLSCPYFSPKCPLLLPCFHLPLRPEGVRSGLPRTQVGIHRVRLASLLHMMGRPSCAGQPYGSPHNILGTCSSGGVCACWLCWLGWRWAERRGTLSLLPPQISHSTLRSAHRAVAPIEITLITGISTDFPVSSNPVTLLFIPCGWKKKKTWGAGSSNRKTKIKNGHVVFVLLT